MGYFDKFLWAKLTKTAIVTFLRGAGVEADETLTKKTLLSLVEDVYACHA